MDFRLILSSFKLGIILYHVYIQQTKWIGMILRFSINISHGSAIIEEVDIAMRTRLS